MPAISLHFEPRVMGPALCADAAQNRPSLDLILCIRVTLHFFHAYLIQAHIGIVLHVHVSRFPFCFGFSTLAARLAWFDLIYASSRLYVALFQRALH